MNVGRVHRGANKIAQEEHVEHGKVVLESRDALLRLHVKFSNTYGKTHVLTAKTKKALKAMDDLRNYADERYFYEHQDRPASETSSPYYSGYHRRAEANKEDKDE